MSFQQVSLNLAAGFLENCRLFLETLLFSIPLGLLISFCSMSKFKPLSFLTKVFVWCIRGTPLMLQLIVIFYGPGLIGSWAEALHSDNAVIQWLATWECFDRTTAVIVSFVINYACYFSEIYRGGIESIPKGQYTRNHT